jgi:hypothetical protein
MSKPQLLLPNLSPENLMKKKNLRRSLNHLKSNKLKKQKKLLKLVKLVKRNQF